MTDTLTGAELRAHDHIVRGTAADGFVRAFAITASQTVQAAADAHELEPFTAEVLGQLLMAAQMMTCGSKDEGEELALLAAGDGALRSVTAIANTKGQVKGYAGDLDKARFRMLRAAGNLNAGAALGQGSLTVVRSNPWMEPYVSQCALAPGQLGQTLTLYYLASEQIPTHIAVEVLMGEDGRVQAAGGYLVQLMPGYEDSLVDSLADNVSRAGSLRDLLATGTGPEALLEKLLEGMGYGETEVLPASFHCDCGFEKAWKTVSSLGTDELRSIVADGEPVRVNCDYCSTTYVVELEQIQELIDSRG
ncbi:MAG: Hsp33 family molecular chaperone HslO [Coriobacteriia bacterium]|nr:Hsp33 family molecular chaperone HslO [Coriobacteriia bacterium]